MPAGFAELGQHLLWLQPGRLALVPGLSCMATDALLTPDVMRGEETQVFGALHLLGLTSADEVTLVLPGTHSKWVTVQRGRITGFATHLTGEVYGLLRHQSLLARMLPADDSAWDSAAFDAGVLAAQQPGGLLHHVFAVRSLALFGQADGPALASRLSGLLIGEELRAQASRPGAALVLVGSDGLVRRYQQALALLGLSTLSVGSEATWAGLLALAGTLPA